MNVLRHFSHNPAGYKDGVISPIFFNSSHLHTLSSRLLPPPSSPFVVGLYSLLVIDLAIESWSVSRLLVVRRRWFAYQLFRTILRRPTWRNARRLPVRQRWFQHGQHSAKGMGCLSRTSRISSQIFASSLSIFCRCLYACRQRQTQQDIGGNQPSVVTVLMKMVIIN